MPNAAGSIPISNIVNISVSFGSAGTPGYNVANLALFTSDAFLSNPNSDTYRVYTSLSAVGTDFGINTETYLQAQAVFAQQPNILNANGNLIIVPFLPAETLAAAIVRANTYLYYNGIISTSYPSPTQWVSLANTVQALGNQLLFLPSQSSSDISSAQLSVQQASDYNARCLYYGLGSATTMRSFAAAYASRLLSTNYSGSNTAVTMNLKPLIGVLPDTTLTSTILNNAVTAGVDCYGNYGGSYPGVISNGANKYADEAMNLIWLVTALQVAGFNALATAQTKIPLTEPGMNALKSAYRLILSQAVANGFLAPGSWPSTYTFGNQQLFLQNIAQYGFYIFSAPVSSLTLAQIQARQAPLVQIAILEAGAIHQSTVLINIMA